jgi:hypothetical protein
MEYSWIQESQGRGPSVRVTQARHGTTLPSQVATRGFQLPGPSSMRHPTVQPQDNGLAIFRCQIPDLLFYSSDYDLPFALICPP